jgi:hypothetical protein
MEGEITPAMIEAGAVAVSRCLGAGELYPPMTEEEFATQIYLAMRAAEKALHESRIACFGVDYGV